MGKEKDSISVFLSLILRHTPEEIEINLDKNGWANVDILVEKFNEKFGKFTKDDLVKIVNEDDKKRYSFDKSLEKIRANQGHSICVDVELTEKIPPEKLYHGTATRFIDSIMREGLKSMSRQYVHMYDEIYLTREIGNRYGTLVILELDAKKMSNDGYKFLISENNVWLTKSVPSKYIRRIE